MIFQKRKDFSQQFIPAPALGGLTQIAISREFHIESLVLIVPVTFAGSAGSGTSTAIGNGLLDIVKRLTLTIQDGSQNRNVFDVTGAGAIQDAATLANSLDSGTNAARNMGNNVAADGTYLIRIPLCACNPSFADPLFSRFLLPAPRYQANPVLNVTLASKAQITSDATATLTLGAPVLEINRRFVNVSGFVPFDFDVIETRNTFAGGGQQIVEIPTPGSYSSLMILNDPDAPAHADLLGGGEARIQMLGQTIQRWIEPTLLSETDSRTTFTPFPGLRMLDFVGDGKGQVASLEGALNTNALQVTGARMLVIQAIAGASAQNFLARRIFGDIRDLRAIK